MSDNSEIKCVINSREVQVAIVLGIISFVLNAFIPELKIWRLTKPHLPRQYFLILDLARIIGLIGACIAGPWAGLIMAFFSVNQMSAFREVDFIVKVIQFMTVGHIHRQLQSPNNILAIPIGIFISLPLHPSLILYFLFRAKIVFLFWVNSLIVQTFVAVGLYLLIRWLAPQIFKWANPKFYYLNFT